MMKFDGDIAINPKVYPSDCTVIDNNCQSIIVITYDDCIFSITDWIWQA